MFRPISSAQPAAMNCSKFIRSTNPKITSNCPIASSPMSDRAIKICYASAVYQLHTWCRVWYALLLNGLGACQYRVHNFIACGRGDHGDPSLLRFADLTLRSVSHISPLTLSADGRFILEAVGSVNTFLQKQTRRNNRTSTARQRTCKHVTLTIHRCFRWGPPLGCITRISCS
jgi:hypothetical protein